MTVEEVASGAPSTPAFEKHPPQDVAAEQCVLGGMMLSKDAIADVVEILRVNDFYRPVHATIFDAILDLYGRGEPADAITVAGSLDSAGELSRIGGGPYLHTLISAVPTAANAAYYARIVSERAVLRRLVEAGTKIVQLGYGSAAGSGRDVDDIVDLAQQAIYDVTERRVSEDFAILADMLQPTLDEIEAVGAQGGLMTGVPTGFTDLDRLLNGLQPGQLIVVAGRPGLGKCLAAETLITEASTGEQIAIAEFVRRGQSGESLFVHTLGDDWKLSTVRPSAFLSNGKQSVVRLVTRSGRTIRATANHPFRTLGGWVALNELAPGDHIAVPRRLPSFWGVNSYDDALVALTAYLIGGGGLTSDTPRLSALNPVIVADASRCAARLGIQAKPVAYRPCGVELCDDVAHDAPGDSAHRLPTGLSLSTPGRSPNPLTDHLMAVGLMGQGSHGKFIPPAYLKMGNRQTRIFLTRLFAADGWVCVMNPNGKRSVQVGYASVSERLARDVQHLLLRLGFNADLARKKVAYRGETRWDWQVYIHNTAEVDRFCREIGVIGKERQVTNMLRECERRDRHSKTDLLPKEVWEIICAEKGSVTWAELSERTGRPRNHNWHVGKQRIGRGRMAEIAKALDSQCLRDLADSDVMWDRVISIEPDGQSEVFDLTIDGTHNFLANDIVVHNSTASMDFARNAAVRNNLAAAIFSLEMSKVEIVMRLLSAEARVPLNVLRSGQLSDDDWTKLARRMGEISEAPIFVDDTPNMNLMEIRAKARRLKQRHDLKLIVVDYLQLMTSPKRTESRQQEVADLSRGLKLLAKEVECPVIAVSQLNRGPEQRTDKRPQLSDLRESGCLTADTRVIRADSNAEVTLGELYSAGDRDIPVWALDERLKYTPRTMTHVFPSGHREVFRVKLASGKYVDATDNHPFLTFGGWVSLADLTVGSRVGAPRHIPPPLSIRLWAEAEIIMLAHMLGDGSFVPRQPIRYASCDEENLAVVTMAAKHWGISAIRDDYAAARVTTLRLPAPFKLARGRRNPIAEWLDGFGLFGKRSHEKFIPQEIFGLPKDQVTLFLQHLWSTDGSVTVNKSGRGGRVYYSSTSRRMLEDVSRLLLRYGITARLREVPQKVYRTQYTLDISGRDDQLRFLREVGVHGARAAGCAALLVSLELLETNTNVDTVPRDIWDRVREILVEQKMSHREFASAIDIQFCGSTLWKHSVSRQRLARIAEVLDSAELELHATNDIFWDEIVSIESLGTQDVFDATVLGTHNFIANGLSLHNSIEQDADVVILLHRDDYYDKESPRAGEADFIVAKHRNGPTDTITVAAQLHLSRFVDMAIG